MPQEAPMSKKQIVATMMNPATSNLGSVGVALLKAAKLEAEKS
jgi:hypothetical protein